VLVSLLELQNPDLLLKAVCSGITERPNSVDQRQRRDWRDYFMIIAPLLKKRCWLSDGAAIRLELVPGFGVIRKRIDSRASRA